MRLDTLNIFRRLLSFEQTFIFSFCEARSMMNLPFSKAFVIVAHKYQGKVFRIALIFLNNRKDEKLVTDGISWEKIPTDMNLRTVNRLKGATDP